MTKKIITAVLTAALTISTLTLAPAAYAAGPLGDVDNDGEITAADARLALRGSVGLEEVTDAFLARADVDKSGAVEASDARTILRASVGLDTIEQDAECEHEYELEVIQPGTCTQTGLAVEHCKKCGAIGKTITTSTEHQWKTVPGTEISATCDTDGFRKRVCELCGEESDEILPKGHIPSNDPTCTLNSVCVLCGEEIAPALGHLYDRNASVTVTTGLPCERCGETGLPGFNDLVNVLKDGKHSFSGFTKTDTDFDEPEFTGLMLLLKGTFEKEFKDMIGVNTEYSDVFDAEPITRYNFNLSASSYVSTLTEDDVQSVTTEHLSGVDFMKAIPDKAKDVYGSTIDFTPFKARNFGNVTKVTVTLKPERYSEVVAKGGAHVIDKVYSGYGRMLDATMGSLDLGMDDMMKNEGDCLSSAVITYYFDDITNEPVAAQYLIKMDMDQAMNIYITDDGEIKKEPTGSIAMNIKTDMSIYYFFDKVD